MTEHTPKMLSERLDFGPFDPNKIRDAIAASLPRRLAEFALALEAFRYTHAAEHSIEKWVQKNRNGRAFYLYILVCHYTSEIVPNAAVFCGYFGNAKSLRTSYYRMFKDWVSAGWINEDGAPTEIVIRHSMRRVFEIMELTEAQVFVTHATNYLTAITNRRREELEEKNKTSISDKLKNN